MEKIHLCDLDLILREQICDVAALVFQIPLAPHISSKNSFLRLRFQKKHNFPFLSACLVYLSDFCRTTLNSL